ncbi:GTPase Era [Candidatus Bandiella euplotis]|uniref:GTPase Era n=1 Tax=Candidatus Bandiella euplotis TaxID=1664265 RepID=A0ABZ0UN08_9RICK|nr:GTPase Era [Candidatus Bandiella woodruffii]WPX96468.1 GTPase Era [Candidatus Bandiella woodruffii]
MNKKTGYVCFLGAPNSGKSTLFNALLNQKISIVTHKVHTTRDNIQGIITEDNTQLIVIDTPGFLKSPKFKLEKAIAKKALQEVNNVDFICILIDAAKKNCLENPLLDRSYFQPKQDPILILNKIDLIREKEKLLLLAEEAKNKGFNHIFMISALNNKGVKALKSYLIDNCPVGEWHYDEDAITNRNMEQLAEDITMEQLYKLLNEEIPYSLKVETESWEEKENEITIHQVITVLKDNQKKIILGSKGEQIKKIGILAKASIYRLTNKAVSLYLFVKVRENWMDHIN